MHQIEIRLRMKRISGFDGISAQRAPLLSRCTNMLISNLIFQKTEQIPLNFKPDGKSERTLPEPIELFPQDMTRREVKGASRGEVVVAKDPAYIWLPRQNAKRCRVGDNH